MLEHALGFAQRPHQHVVGGLLATELFSLAALLRENHNLTVAGPAGAAHALDRADGVDDVEEYDQVHARDVEALLPDGCGHQGVEGAVAESVEDVALLLLSAEQGTERRAQLIAELAAAADLTCKRGDYEVVLVEPGVARGRPKDPNRRA